MFKRFVYVLRNHESPTRYYTGLTSNVAERLAIHNAAGCMHTAKYGPWSLDVVIEFPDEHRAAAFERYLKTGSGVAFSDICDSHARLRMLSRRDGDVTSELARGAVPPRAA